MKLKRLTDKDVLYCQKRGYFDEHLTTLYSIAWGEPYLYKDKYLLYHDRLSNLVWLTLFKLDKENSKSKDRACLQDCFQICVRTFKPKKITITSPVQLAANLNGYHCKTTYQDEDFQINLNEFDETLKGSSYKNLRHRVNHSKRCGYLLTIGKTLTRAHSHIMALHLTQNREYRYWDYQLYIRLGEYLSTFSSPKLFNVLLNNILIGFDVADSLTDTLATPFGFCLRYPSLADFLIYEEILHAKSERFRWLDIGWGCNTPGLEKFKKKWKAVSRFKVFMQEYHKVK